MLFSFTRAGSPQQYIPITVYIYFFYLAYPQEQGHHNSMSQSLWARMTYLTLSPCRQLSLWEETGVPGENPRLSAEC